MVIFWANTELARNARASLRLSAGGTGSDGDVGEVAISLNVNGDSRECAAPPTMRLSAALRDILNLTSVKEGCCEGECGACTILLDGKPVNSCLVMVFQARGMEIITVEGLLPETGLNSLQQAFLDEGAVQCGYCTPGMVMAAEGLLGSSIQTPTRWTSATHWRVICRCTGFETMRAGRERRSGRPPGDGSGPMSALSVVAPPDLSTLRSLLAGAATPVHFLAGGTDP